MTLESFYEYCFSKPHVEESYPFGPDTLVLRVNGKIFLLMGLDRVPLQFNVKCDPEIAVDLRERHDCVIPGYHMNKKHWNTIVIDGSVPDSLLKEWIDYSYELVSLQKPIKRPKAASKANNKKKS